MPFEVYTLKNQSLHFIVWIFSSIYYLDEMAESIEFVLWTYLKALISGEKPSNRQG